MKCDLVKYLVKSDLVKPDAVSKLTSFEFGLAVVDNLHPTHVVRF